MEKFEELEGLLGSLEFVLYTLRAANVHGIDCKKNNNIHLGRMGVLLYNQK
jgi:hypothetical protein